MRWVSRELIGWNQSSHIDDMIHVIGGGNIGSLIATKLAPKFPLSLMLKPSAMHSFRRAQQNISLVADGVEHETHVELDRGGPISSIIVALKAYNVRKALESVLDRLSPSTSILCIHNGMGVYDELLQLWPHPETRPSLAFGVTSSGVKNREIPFHFEAVSLSPFILSVPENTGPNNSAVRAMLESQHLVAGVELEWEDFRCRQLEKLVTNAIINPLTALVDCSNGALLELDTGIMRALVNEACFVLSEDDPLAKAVLDSERILEIVRDVCNRTASNTSSMRADVGNGKPTEVQYINGYIAEKARQFGRRAPRHELLTNLVSMAMSKNKHVLNDILVPFRD